MPAEPARGRTARCRKASARLAGCLHSWLAFLASDDNSNYGNTTDKISVLKRTRQEVLTPLLSQLDYLGRYLEPLVLLLLSSPHGKAGSAGNHVLLW